MGAKSVVIKGIVHEGEGIIRNYLASAQDGGKIEEVQSELLPYMLHGTGDLFASALCAAIYTGRSLHDAVDFAGELVRDAMRVTREQPDFEVRGVSSSPRWAKWRTFSHSAYCATILDKARTQRAGPLFSYVFPLGAPSVRIPAVQERAVGKLTQGQ